MGEGNRKFTGFPRINFAWTQRLTEGVCNHVYGPQPFLVNKVLLEPRYLLYLCIVCSWLPVIRAELSSCGRESTVCKLSAYSLYAEKNC